MKRIFSLMLAVLAALNGVPALAEATLAPTEDVWQGVWNSVGEAWTEAGRAAEQAWTETEKAAQSAWDSIGEATGEAWKAAGEAAGEALKAAGEAAGEMWDLAGSLAAEKGEALRQTALELLDDMRAWLDAAGEGALDVLRQAFDITTEGLGIDVETAEALWTEAMQYADECGIDQTDMAKLALAAVVQVKAQGAEDIRAAVMAFIENSGVTGPEGAEDALEALEEELKQVP